MTAGRIDAGEFGAWLRGFRAALRADAASDVPCGTCTGCCTSSYFVTVRPQDGAARRLIPAEYLVAAPNAAPGVRLMGYDARGHCPMLSDGRCSIYADRPQTCRTYDCRVYAAAGLSPGADKPAIAERVRAWEFTYADDGARRAHDAVRRAARFIRDDAAGFPRGAVPDRAGEVAVAALKAYEAFIDLRLPEAREDKRRLAERTVELVRAFDAAAGSG